ncbi:MAG: DUF4345 domain-containing protein [Anaerolineales bacterium]
MNRKALQAYFIILGLVPVITGILGLMGVDDPLYASLGLPRNALLDGNMRFYSDVWFVLGLTVLWTVRSLENHFGLYRVLWAMIFVGGLGRLLSIFLVGAPPLPFIGFTVLEILGAPLFLYWRHRVASQRA